MAILPIIIAPDPRLKVKARPVSEVNAGIRRLMDDMLATMYGVPGIGLAAPQVDQRLRVLVLDVALKGEPPQPLKIANPEIVWRSEETVECEEGCLSFPEQFAMVTRPTEVKVRYLDYDNAWREVHAKGLLAVCLQHEMDHLEGIVFVDRISTLRRSIILRRLAKAKKAKSAPVPA